MPCVSSGVYPGSFNPPTIAHLAIANAGRKHYGLDRVELAISRVALDKETVTMPTFEDRVDVVRRSCDDLEWLDVVVTNDQLLADIADGYDVVIMGADKWEQVNDERYYADAAARDAAVAALPETVVATRDGAAAPADLALATPPELRSVSSTAARGGDRDQMAPVARERWA